MNGQLFTRITSILACTGITLGQRIAYVRWLVVIPIPVLALTACTGSTGPVDFHGGLFNGILQLTPPTQNTDGSPLTDLSGYIVYYGTSPDTLNQKFVLDSPDLSSYDVMELVDHENILPGTTYYLSIKAVNSRNIRSRSSNIVSIR